MIPTKGTSHLPHILAALRARYPDLEVLSVTLTRWPDGTFQQNADYRGPLSTMMRYGLVTAAMIENAHDGRRGLQNMPNGDGFSLFCRGAPEAPAELMTFTGDTPRERPRLGLGDARRELKRIMGARAKG